MAPYVFAMLFAESGHADETLLVTAHAATLAAHAIRFHCATFRLRCSPRHFAFRLRCCISFSLPPPLFFAPIDFFDCLRHMPPDRPPPFFASLAATIFSRRYRRRADAPFEAFAFAEIRLMLSSPICPLLMRHMLCRCVTPLLPLLFRCRRRRYGRLPFDDGALLRAAARCRQPLPPFAILLPFFISRRFATLLLRHDTAAAVATLLPPLLPRLFTRHEMAYYAAY